MEKLKEHKLTIIGLIIGAIGGFLYWHFVGCNAGCPITSKPVNSTIYGAVMGALALNIFKPEKKAIVKTEEKSADETEISANKVQNDENSSNETSENTEK